MLVNVGFNWCLVFCVVVVKVYGCIIFILLFVKFNVGVVLFWYIIVFVISGEFYIVVNF